MSSLCDYSDAYILASGIITFAEVVFENCVPFTNCISETNNTKIDNAKYIDVIMPVCNSIEYGDNYSETSRHLWQYYRDEPALTDAGAVVNFPGNGVNLKKK